MIEYALAIELNMAQIEADAKLLREHEEKYLEITLTEPPTLGDKTLFWVTQSLDIYSTYRGLQYDCVEETNLFLSDRPEVEDMVALKGSIFLLVPPRTAQDYKHINLITSVAAINNFVVLDRAKKRCIKL
jgi:hypothetical protein